MNRYRQLRAVAFALLLALSSPTVASAKDGKTVERGMTKAQVTDIVGKPMTTSFNASGETWTYEKTRGGLLSSYEVRITVVFDADGRVDSYSEAKVAAPAAARPSQPAARPSQGASSFGGDCRHYGTRRALSDADFSTLLSKVKGASFADRQLDLIQVACLGGWLTCRQGAALLGVFSFSDKKMKALGFIAPHLTDPQNANDIYRQFSFSSDKDKAAELIRRSQR